MSNVTGITNPAQTEYRLVGHGCSPAPSRDTPAPGTTLTAVTGQPAPPAGPTPGAHTWVGSGLAALGLTPGAPLPEADFDQARRLLTGRHPLTRQQLIAPKTRVAASARVHGRTLLDAIDTELTSRGQQPGEAFPSNRQQDHYRRLRSGVDRRPGSHTIPATQAATLLKTLDLDPDHIYPPGVFAQALSHKGAREVVGNTGYDLTITFPKSFSIAAGIAPDPLADSIEACLTQAATEALHLIETHTAYGMRGHHGDGHTAQRIPTFGFAGWATTHHTSRAQDPHFHLHFTVANLALGEDGTWSTIGNGGRDLMNHVHLAGAYAEARARHLLAEKHGFTYTRSPRTGRYEIDGIPDQLIAHHSTRNTEIRELLDGTGTPWQDATPAQDRHAADATRRAKPAQPSTTAELRDRWRTEATDLGHHPDEISAAITHQPAPNPDPSTDGPAPLTDPMAAPGRQPDAPDADQITTELLDPDSGLTANSKAFRRREAMAQICERLPDGIASPEQLEELTRHLLDHTDVVDMPHADGTAHLSNADRYTTQDLIDAETALLHATHDGLDADLAVVDPTVLADALALFESSAGHPLDEQQRAVLTRLLTDGHAIDTVVGVPGSGKTSVMAAARIAWEADGHTVAGASTAALAAEHLGDAAGLSRTGSLAYWITRITHGTGLAGVDVLIIDESGMTDSRDLAFLLDHAAATDTKSVLIGDPHQLPSPGVGGAFQAMHDILHNGAPDLTINRRQTDPLERQALQAFRDRDHRTALTAWAASDRLTITLTPDEARLHTVLDWWTHWDAYTDPHDRIDNALMLAHRNDDVELLNHAARALAATARHLHGPDVLYHRTDIDPLPLAVGDTVILRHNDRRQWTTGQADLHNGRRGVITYVDDDADHVRFSWRDTDGTITETTIGADYIARGGIDHAYGLTVHKAQGQQADHVSLLSITPERALLYTGMSRDTLTAHSFQPATELTQHRTLEQWAALSPDDRTRDAIAMMAERLDQQYPATMAVQELGHPLAPQRSRPGPRNTPEPDPDEPGPDEPQPPEPGPAPTPNGTEQPEPGTTATPPPTSDPAQPAPAPIPVDVLLQAAELVITSQWGSASMLQRKLLLPTADAEAVMHHLHNAGIIGPADGNRTRDVLHPPQELPAALHALTQRHTPTSTPHAQNSPHDRPGPAQPNLHPRTPVNGPWLRRLGRLPDTPQDRDAWVTLAARINAYRTDHNITDDHPLGPKPTQPLPQAEWQNLTDALAHHDQQRLHAPTPAPPEPTPDHGRQRITDDAAPPIQPHPNSPNPTQPQPHQHTPYPQQHQGPTPRM